MQKLNQKSRANRPAFLYVLQNLENEYNGAMLLFSFSIGWSDENTGKATEWIPACVPDWKRKTRNQLLDSARCLCRNRFNAQAALLKGGIKASTSWVLERLLFRFSLSGQCLRPQPGQFANLWKQVYQKLGTNATLDVLVGNDTMAHPVPAPRSV